MKQLRLGFTDTFGTAINFFTHVLSSRYEIIRDDDNPDYLIFGDPNFGQNHFKYTGKCKKIFYTGENVRPSYYTYDHAITFDHEISSKHYRLPLYVLEMYMMSNEGWKDYLWLTNERPKLDFEQMSDKNGFCSFIQSNPKCEVRNKFFHFLNSKEKVSSYGPLFNNVGRVIPRDIRVTIDVMSEYFFSISFENGQFPGYVTEKLLNAFYACTIPIYYGSKTVYSDFNTKAFINCHDYGSFEEVYDKILELKLSKTKYIDMLSQPVFNSGIPNQYTNLDSFLTWWDTFIYE